MAEYKIIQDHEACIGCGTCVSLCPKNWEMGDDGKARPEEKKVSTLGCNQEAAENCPVQCIKIKAEK